jgi:RNA polymerase sigma factor for flagellar operon FliA
MKLADYQQLLQDARGYQLVSAEDLQGDGDESFPRPPLRGLDGPTRCSGLLDEDRRRTLVEAIEALPDREKKMMGLYYEQELNLREIGKCWA